jgi:hypothetical protein
MRKPLIVLLGLGVLFGYGSALGHMRHRWHHGGAYGEGGCDRWSQRYDEPAPVVTAPAPAPAPAPVQQQPVMPQIIIVQPQAVPAAPAPMVIVQQPQAAAPSAPIIVPVPQAPAAPAANTDNLKAKPSSPE